MLEQPVRLLAMLGGLMLSPQTMTPALAQNIPLPPGVVFFEGHRYLLPEDGDFTIGTENVPAESAVLPV